MNRRWFMVLASCLALNGVGAPSKPTPESVKALTQKVADWQIATFEEQGTYRAIGSTAKWQNRQKYHDLKWHNAALYAGLNEWRETTGDKKAEAFLRKIGERNQWNLYTREYNADDHAVGQFYTSLYDEFREPKMIKPTQERFDWILANRRTGSLMWSGYGKNKHKTDCHKRWGWCDALFMAPPVWARLAKVTGDRKYLEFMDEEYHATADLLWSEEHSMFFRDSSFFKRTEKNGQPIFWGRGNGWVFGGLALMIPDLPADWEGREFYVNTFRTMAKKVKEIQRPDGTWSMGLLGGVDGYPNIETSGSSFFTFGLAWGINNGILDPTQYKATVLKGWKALEGCVQEDGLLGYVQPVGVAPGESFANKSEVFGVGAFLAAGSEVYKLLGGECALAQ